MILMGLFEHHGILLFAALFYLCVLARWCWWEAGIPSPPLIFFLYWKKQKMQISPSPLLLAAQLGEGEMGRVLVMKRSVGNF